MPKFMNQFWLNIRVMAPEDDGKGGSAGGGGKQDPPAPDPAKALAELQASNKALLDRLAALENKNNPKPDDDPDDLAKKAQLKREEDDRKAGDQKAFAAALRFNDGSKDFLKNNEGVLPKSIAPLFEMAAKEKYDSEIEKASAIKVGIVQEFFALQENLDLLTEGQKIALEDFSKLTKNEKQRRVGDFYASVFEPTLEGLKRTKKAAALRDGLDDPSSNQQAYEKKLQDQSRKHHMRRSFK